MLDYHSAGGSKTSRDLDHKNLVSSLSSWKLELLKTTLVLLLLYFLLGVFCLEINIAVDAQKNTKQLQYSYIVCVPNPAKLLAAKPPIPGKLSVFNNLLVKMNLSEQEGSNIKSSSGTPSKEVRKTLDVLEASSSETQPLQLKRCSQRPILTSDLQSLRAKT